MAECPGIWRLAETKDGGLARLRLPGGGMTAGQMEAVARLARDRGNGLIDLTHRANLQVRGLDPRAGEAIAQSLAADDLLADEPRADRLRNIAAPPLAGLEINEIIDVGPMAHALDTALQATPALFTLSPKFSFVLDGGGQWGVSGLAHDVGFFAETNGAKVVLRVSLAGSETDYVVVPEGAAEAGIALAETVADCAGEMPSRMSTLLDRWPAGEIVGRAARDRGALFAERPRLGARTRALTPVIGPVAQRQSGRQAFGLGIPHGRFSHDEASAIAVLARRFGDGTLRLAPWQAVFLPMVEDDAVPDLSAEARAAGFLTDAGELRIRVLACAGASGCVRTGADTKADAARLLTALNGTLPRGDRPVTIHLSGCGRGCAHPVPADLLLLGGAASETYEAYRGACPMDPTDSALLASGLESRKLAAFVMQFLHENA